MITIDLLKNHPDSIPRLAEIWHEVLGRIWVPDIPVERVIQRFHEHLNENSLPLTFVGFDDKKPIGMCSLRNNDGIRPNLTPWLGSLVVDPLYQKKGIGKTLINITKKKSKELGFKRIYLFTFDPDLPKYYNRFEFETIALDEFQRRAVTVMECTL